MNCAVLGSFLIPLKPQRRKRTQEGAKLLIIQDDITGTLTDVEANNGSQINGKSLKQSPSLEQEPLTYDKLSQQKVRRNIILKKKN